MCIDMEKALSRAGSKTTRGEPDIYGTEYSKVLGKGQIDRIFKKSF